METKNKSFVSVDKKVRPTGWTSVYVR